MKRHWWSLALRASVVLLGVAAHADQDIYTDGLTNGWQDWSYRAAQNLTNATPVHGGTKSISVTATNYGALYFHATAQDSSLFTNLTFWINGGATGGQSVTVAATLGGSPQGGAGIAALPTNSWRQITLSMLELHLTNAPNFDGFWIQVNTAGVMPKFYVDDIKLVSAPPAGSGTNTPVTVQVDALADRHPISPLIYGVCWASSNQLRELNAPLNRSGGNATSRYNWTTNGSNHASDYYFESLEENGSGPGAMGDEFIRDSKNGGAQPMLTMPINGWVAKLGPNNGKLASFSIAKYGPQTGNDWQYMPDAGNGISTNGAKITGNDPTDANIAVTTNFQAGWVQHLTNLWGTAANGGLRYYLMDNEWGLWHDTHRDVWPVGATMEQMRDRFCDYATMVRGIDSNAIVLGPEEWGWTGYFYSGYDAQQGALNGWTSFPDRAAHGGSDFMPWWLDQVKQRSQSAGKRLLDVFTLHIYPQSGEFGDDVSSAMQLRRNRSTRSLWDTNYTDESWIADKVQLIPRMKAWVATNYPGTLIGITEYSWGAETNINGATAQADILGIFGREGVDLATRWVVPPTGSHAYKAFQMYRNYDGNKSTFGHTSMRATAPSPDNLSAFAAVRTNDAALTVMVVNKVLANPTPVMLALTNFPATSLAQVWQLTASNVITRLADAPVSNGVISYLAPAQSLTLFVIPSGPPRLSASGVSPMNLLVDGVAGQSYVTQISTNLTAWTSHSTNLAISNQLTMPVATTNFAPTFFRSYATP